MSRELSAKPWNGFRHSLRQPEDAGEEFVCDEDKDKLEGRNGDAGSEESHKELEEDEQGAADVRHPIFLAGVSMDMTGKRPPPCYQFAREGECSFANCKYSHHPSDIKTYQELEKHKDILKGVFKKSYEKNQPGTHSRKTS